VLIVLPLISEYQNQSFSISSIAASFRRLSIWMERLFGIVLS
jgi:hypothetical protein